MTSATQRTAPRIRQANPDGRPVIAVSDLLSRISLHDARVVMTNFLLERAGLPGQSSIARELVRNGISGEALMRHFTECRALALHDLPEIATAIIGRIEIPEIQAPHRKLAKFIQAKDYRAATIIANVDSVQFGTGGELAERKVAAITATGIELTVTEQPRGAVALARHQILNGAANFVDLPRMLMNQALRLEAADLFAVLESGLLHDGNQAFTTTNSATGTSLADIAAALAKFRDSADDLEPRYFVVPAASELAANQAIFQSGMADKLSVIATSGVTSSYLLADPQSWPVLVRLALTEMPLVESWPGKFETDVVLRLTCENDHTHALVSSRGIVKLTSGT